MSLSFIELDTTSQLVNLISRKFLFSGFAGSFLFPLITDNDYHHHALETLITSTSKNATDKRNFIRLFVCPDFRYLVVIPHPRKPPDKDFWFLHNYLEFIEYTLDPTNFFIFHFASRLICAIVASWIWFQNIFGSDVSKYNNICFRRNLFASVDIYDFFGSTSLIFWE